MIYGYIRVSTDKQTVENQRFEINNFVKRENLIIDRWIEETKPTQQILTPKEEFIVNNRRLSREEMFVVMRDQRLKYIDELKYDYFKTVLPYREELKGVMKEWKTGPMGAFVRMIRDGKTKDNPNAGLYMAATLDLIDLKTTP